MKVFLFFCVINLGLGLQGISQSMNFSRVKLLSSVEDTVPVGKVWKVEALWTNSSYQSTGSGACTQGIAGREVLLNGTSYYIQGMGIGYGGTPGLISGHSVPFWLPAGSRLRTSCASTTLSILEFTITP